MAQRHAPKGPLKAKVASDPMTTPHLMAVKCKAHNRQGKQCGQPAIAGGAVCRYHGGAAPQVKEAALMRLIRMQHPAIDRLIQLMEQRDFPSTAYQATKDVLDRTMGRAAESVTVQHGGKLVIQVELPE